MTAGIGFFALLFAIAGGFVAADPGTVEGLAVVTPEENAETESQAVGLTRQS